MEHRPLDSMAYGDLPDLKYRPISKARREIRLLEFPTSQCHTAKPIAKLRHVSMQDAKFVALSYTWGTGKLFLELENEDEPNHSSRLPVSINAFEALENVYGQELVHDVLKHIFGQDTQCLIWIDQICIDQENNEEKSWQVEMMVIIPPLYCECLTK